MLSVRQVGVGSGFFCVGTMTEASVDVATRSHNPISVLDQDHFPSDEGEDEALDEFLQFIGRRVALCCATLILVSAAFASAFWI